MVNTYKDIASPAFVIDQYRLIQNLKLIQKVQEESGIKVILALKAFANWALFPLIKGYLHGATASSLNEARLIFEEMKVKAHTYAPAYIPGELEELLSYSSHLTFNSWSQFKLYKDKIKHSENVPSIGIRINPEYSEVGTDLYNPATPSSRLGVLKELMPAILPKEIDGLHVHTLCESSAQASITLLKIVEKNFSTHLSQIKWLNLGGGHLMTQKGYDLPFLIKELKAFKNRHPHLELILEPGSAVVWETGELLATVLDIVENRSVKTAIADVSFTAHMPDTLEMPYRPKIIGGNESGEGPYKYRIGGVSCLAGDYIESYGFEKELRVGDPIIFLDMIHYTMVKTTMFNGVTHPSLYLVDSKAGTRKLLRKFNYFDFKSRLG